MGSVGQYSGQKDIIENVLIENAWMLNSRKSLIGSLRAHAMIILTGRQNSVAVSNRGPALTLGTDISTMSLSGTSGTGPMITLDIWTPATSTYVLR